ncbi:hypothetical protein AFCDBAGC_4432 [Methylobacterium cerastii]|uniref:Transposase n=1 Tax=Methylobacterium cerastii TaxID=932741 RepID=A0ABQ4QNR7_9HYPH|nr:hypothetical protein AFCDBAGC_4432 [Methylobacterium cerastii]
MGDVTKATELAARIEVVPTLLEVICQTTGMGFSTVARVTEERWIACGVQDDSGFGAYPGRQVRRRDDPRQRWRLIRALT